MKYKITIRDAVPRDAFKNDKKTGSCFIGVSLENPNFDIKYVPSILQWVESNFDHCTIIIADYLYRHSLEIARGVTEDEAIKMALYKGQLLYNEYMEVIPANIHFSLHRWRDKECALSQEYIISFENICRSNKMIMEDIDADAHDYLKRKNLITRDNPQYPFNEKLALCRKYIIEEMAFINYQAEMGRHCSIYPGTQLQVLKNFSLNKYNSCNLALKCMEYYDLKIKK